MGVRRDRIGLHSNNQHNQTQSHFQAVRAVSRAFEFDCMIEHDYVPRHRTQPRTGRAPPNRTATRGMSSPYVQTRSPFVSYLITWTYELLVLLECPGRLNQEPATHALPAPSTARSSGRYWAPQLLSSSARSAESTLQSPSKSAAQVSAGSPGSHGSGHRPQSLISSAKSAESTSQATQFTGLVPSRRRNPAQGRCHPSR